MIPDFKTYINESIWSDIQKRSAGETVRKEDDIDLLDFDGFYKHIEDRYKNKVYDIDDTFIGGDGFQSCDVYFTDDINLTIRFYNDTSKEKKITFFWETGIEQSFIDELGKRFNIYDTGNHAIDIFPKEGKVSNSFFIEILEFILKNMDNMLIESIWSDIQKRSTGDVVRKEDDVDNLDMLGLLDYIQKKYEFGKEVIVLSSSIGIPLFSYESNITYLTISFTSSQDRIYDVYSRFIYDSPLKDSISSILKQKYLIKIVKENSISKYDVRHFALISTKPKEGDMDNRFVINVIDTYIDIMDTFKDIDKYIKRK